MPRTSPLFLELGFEVWQVPGVSRAWRRDFEDGHYILVTDVGGYDLPEPGGPYAAISLSSSNELVEFAGFLRETKTLVRWLDHLSRSAAYHQRQSHR